MRKEFKNRANQYVYLKCSYPEKQAFMKCMEQNGYETQADFIRAALNQFVGHQLFADRGVEA